MRSLLLPLLSALLFANSSLAMKRAHYPTEENTTATKRAKKHPRKAKSLAVENVSKISLPEKLRKPKDLLEPVKAKYRCRRSFDASIIYAITNGEKRFLEKALRFAHETDYTQHLNDRFGDLEPLIALALENNHDDIARLLLVYHPDQIDVIDRLIKKGDLNGDKVLEKFFELHERSARIAKNLIEADKNSIMSIVDIFAKTNEELDDEELNFLSDVIQKHEVEISTIKSVCEHIETLNYTKSFRRHFSPALKKYLIEHVKMFPKYQSSVSDEITKDDVIEFAKLSDETRGFIDGILATSEGEFEFLPNDVVSHIFDLAELTDNDKLVLAGVNKTFYKIITGYPVNNNSSWQTKRTSPGFYRDSICKSRRCTNNKVFNYFLSGKYAKSQKKQIPKFLIDPIKTLRIGTAFLSSDFKNSGKDNVDRFMRFVDRLSLSTVTNLEMFLENPGEVSGRSLTDKDLFEGFVTVINNLNKTKITTLVIDKGIPGKHLNNLDVNAAKSSRLIDLTLSADGLLPSQIPTDAQWKHVNEFFQALSLEVLRIKWSHNNHAWASSLIKAMKDSQIKTLALDNLFQPLGDDVTTAVTELENIDFISFRLKKLKYSDSPMEEVLLSIAKIIESAPANIQTFEIVNSKTDKHGEAFFTRFKERIANNTHHDRLLTLRNFSLATMQKFRDLLPKNFTITDE